jgi:charged multivesicular body protein 1
MEGAKIHAQNAIRKQTEALNFLQLSSRLDAVVGRLEHQSKMSQTNRTMAGIVKNLNKALKGAPLDKVVTVRDRNVVLVALC